MELNDKVTQLEDEIKILKNEIQAVLLDLRESYLNNKNPFNMSAPPVANQPVSSGQMPPELTVPAVNETTKEVPAPQISLETMTQPIVAVSESLTELEQTGKEKQVPAGLVDGFGLLKASGTVIENGNYSQDPPEPVIEKTSTGANREWRVKSSISGICGESPKSSGKYENIEISVVGKLAKWVEESVKQQGAGRTETMLGVAELMGYLGRDLKDILARLIVPAAATEIGKTYARDYLASWVDLATILGKDNKPEIALFYMLCQEAENR